jgi:hypothetical protein
MRIKLQGEVGKKGERNDRLTCNLKDWESNAGERVTIGKGARVGSLKGHCYSTGQGITATHQVQYMWAEECSRVPCDVYQADALPSHLCRYKFCSILRTGVVSNANTETSDDAQRRSRQFV